MTRVKVDDYYWNPPPVKDKLSNEAQRLIDEALANNKARRFPLGFRAEVPWQIWEKGYLKLPQSSPTAISRILAKYSRVRVEIAAGMPLNEIRKKFSGLQQLETFLEGVRAIEPELWARMRRTENEQR